MIPDSKIAEAEKVMGRKMKNEFGSCFDSVPKELLDIGHLIPIGRDWFKITDNTKLTSMKVNHGIGISNMPGQEGHEMAHAWLEFDTDGSRWAYDVIWGFATNSDYYRGQLKIIKVIEYDVDEFLDLWKKKGDPGPFDPEIRKITDRCGV